MKICQKSEIFFKNAKNQPLRLISSLGWFSDDFLCFFVNSWLILVHFGFPGDSQRSQKGLKWGVQKFMHFFAQGLCEIMFFLQEFMNFAQGLWKFINFAQSHICLRIGLTTLS